VLREQRVGNKPINQNTRKGNSNPTLKDANRVAAQG
jgi:hypothetical protein